MGAGGENNTEGRRRKAGTERKHKQKGRQGMRDTIVNNTEFGNRIVVIQLKNCRNAKGLRKHLINCPL